jgi:hypothetical protein
MLNVIDMADTLEKLWKNGRLGAVLGCLMFLWACAHETLSEDRFLKGFNIQAKNSFTKRFDSLDLYPLTDSSKKKLKNCIERQLDEINDWRTVVLDSFYIRNYRCGTMGSFSFVAVNGKYHFLYLPRLFDFFDVGKYYYNGEDTSESTIGPEFAITRINSAGMDEFLENEIFSSPTKKSRFKVASQFLREILPELTREPITLNKFGYWLEQQPIENQNVIGSVILPITERKPIFNNDRDYMVFHVESMGFVFFDFHLDDNASLNMVLDIYFIPYGRKSEFGHKLDVTGFPECY